MSPPSTSNVLPVRLPAGEAKYTAAYVDWATEPAQWWSSLHRHTQLVAATTSSAEVRMEPGAIALTRTRGH